MKFQVSAIALGCIALLSGCGGGGGSSDGGKSQSITFNFAGGPLIGIPPNVTTTKLVAMASGGGPVTFTSETTTTCTVSGDTLTFVKAGECAVTAHQAGGNGYAAASQSQLFVIPKNPQSIVQFRNPGWQALDSTPVVLSASTTSGLPVTFTSKTPSVCSVNGNTMTKLANGTCTVTAASEGDYYQKVSMDRSIPIGTEKAAALNFLTGYKDDGTTKEGGLIGHLGGNQWWCPPDACTHVASSDGSTYTFTATWNSVPQPGSWNYNSAIFWINAAGFTDDSFDPKGSYRGTLLASNFDQTGNASVGLHIDAQAALKFNFGENPEWFGSTNNSFNVDLVLGHFNLKNGTDACSVTLRATVKPTAAVADYSVGLKDQFAISETCGLTGLDLWNELQDHPITQIKFSAVQPNADVADSASKYTTQFKLTGPIYFQ
jgi:hypothetical protein